MALNMQARGFFSQQVHISCISSDMPSKIPNSKDGNTKDRKMTHIFLFCTVSNKALPLYCICNSKSQKNDSWELIGPA